MSFYPVFLNLTGRRVLVVGGGPVAERKVLSLLEAGAKVRLVSPQITPALRALVSKRRVTYRHRKFRKADVAGVDLVICATGDERVNRRVYALATARRLFANVVDRPALCSFIAPAVVRKGDVQIAISTGGRSPALAVRIKEEIAGLVGNEYAELLDLLAAVRPRVLARIRTPEERARIFHAIVRSPALDLLRQGRRREALRQVRKIAKL